MTFYLDDDEAREDWDAEREAFMRPADEEDQLPTWEEGEIPERFWIDSASGLPVVKDRLHSDVVLAKFLTLTGATAYKALLDVGVGHTLAIMANPEFEEKEAAS